ncbi:AraC family transcriptional regulator [Paenibacillus cisolokensis]|uniref:AraC family transcriptional regulator n=1 Tax=Paenibacillus cisolokensis TaxID=1658519 RepID=UPI003D2921C5
MSDRLPLPGSEEAGETTEECGFPPYITLAHLFNAPAGWEIRTRALSMHQFQYVKEGAAEYVVDGKSYTTRKGDLIYHAPYVPHAVRTIEGEPYLCISILFHFGSLRISPELLGLSSGYVGNYAGHPVEGWLSRLIAHYHQPGAHNRMLCQGLLLQTIAELDASRSGRNATPVQEKTKAKIVLVRNYILRHYGRNIRHEELERVSGLSRNYMIVKFRHIYGMTPFEYLTFVRVEKAKELAVQTNLSVGEIARLVGYSDVHTFGRMFKNKTGTSISQFCSSLVT